MKLKSVLLVLFLSFLLAGCGTKKATNPSDSKLKSLTTKLLINELPLKDRPFITLVPHATNRLFTFVGMNINKAKESSVDLEYQSGDLLKGVKANIDSPIPNPFVKAIILGSCSTGGKCSFDKDLKSGTTKLKLNFAGQEATHLLKGDFTFVMGQKNLPDGKVSFEPSKLSAKENLILMNSFGLPKEIDKETVLYPVIISSANDKIISGILSLTSTATSALIYDGTTFQPLKTITKDGQIIVNLNQRPWSVSAEITRDDEKGSKESLKLYLLGPIVLIK